MGNKGTNTYTKEEIIKIIQETYNNMPSSFNKYYKIIYPDWFTEALKNPPKFK